MQHLHSADYLVIGAFTVALIGLSTWVITYAWSTRGDWRFTREGRHLMSFRASLAAFMAMGVVNNVWPRYPGRDEIRVAIASLFAAAVLDGLRVLFLAQRERRRDRLMQVGTTTKVDSAR